MHNVIQIHWQLHGSMLSWVILLFQISVFPTDNTLHFVIVQNFPLCYGKENIRCTFRVINPIGRYQKFDGIDIVTYVSHIFMGFMLGNTLMILGCDITRHSIQIQNIEQYILKVKSRIKQVTFSCVMDHMLTHRP